MTRGATLFSGIGAPELAMPWVDWRWCAEIEPFPSAVLAYHRPDVPNLGDVTKVDWHEIKRTNPIDILVYGSPCQSFSVAGKRLGMDDHRGNLALVALGILHTLQPEWFIFENVPGLLSSAGGRDFGALLATMGECGYGCAWRVLGAQHFGVPQRRRRVFVVGHLGDWRRAASVLFEPESLRGDTSPRREAGERVAAGLTRGADSSGRGGYAGRRREDDTNIVPALCASGRGVERTGESRGQDPVVVCHQLTARHDSSEDGSGRGLPLVVEEDNQNGVRLSETTGAVRANAPGTKPGGSLLLTDDVACTLPASDGGVSSGMHPVVAIQDGRYIDKAQNGKGWSDDGVAYTVDAAATQAIAFQSSQSGVREVDAHATLDSNNGSRRHNGVVQGMAVRRLTPRECERLQGFPDDFTAIPYKGKPAADGPRYRALGNSMAVPVVRWIGDRLRSSLAPPRPGMIGEKP